MNTPSALRAVPLIVLLALAPSGSAGTVDDRSDVGETMQAIAPPRAALLQALSQLHSSDLATREAAIKGIDTLEVVGLSSAEVSAIVTAASSGLPKAKFDFQSYDAHLLRTIWKRATNEHLALIGSAYTKLSAKGQAAAMAALANIGTREASLALVAIARQHGWPRDSYRAITRPFEESHRFGDILLPPMLDGSIRALPDDLPFSLLLAYVDANALPDGLGTVARDLTVKAARRTTSALSAAKRPSGIGWRFADEYIHDRNLGGLLFDLLGRFPPSPESLAVLTQGSHLVDPRPRLFALLSLVRLGKPADPNALREVAHDPETRILLLASLNELRRADLFPGSELTQEKLAESDMVNWLTFPTELARAPDQIELMSTVERDLGQDHEVLVYYVFRFRTEPPHWSANDGWMAGISGPFPKSQFPTIDSLGDTFSTFTKWDEFTPDEHLASVQDLMERWRQHQARPRTDN